MHSFLLPNNYCTNQKTLTYVQLHINKIPDVSIYYLHHMSQDLLYSVLPPSLHAETIAKVFIEQVICRHGAPEQFLTDNECNFCVELMVEVNELLQISPQHLTPYHQKLVWAAISADVLLHLLLLAPDSAR